MDKPQRCQVCNQTVEVKGLLGRRDACPNCGADLHACQQCQFHDLHASNQCREAQAERVGNKEQANFCDFFRLSRAEGGHAAAGNAADEARRKLEALFGK